MRKILLLTLLISMPTAIVAEENLELVLDAARKMDWPYENRPFLLIKRETVRAGVALIFGYVSNEEACEDLAAALSETTGVGTFECDAIR